ncbi:MAG: hypothetical protein ACNI27_12645 [Desulfovibrio sp.]
MMDYLVYIIIFLAFVLVLAGFRAEIRDLRKVKYEKWFTSHLN